MTLCANNEGLAATDEVYLSGWEFHDRVKAEGKMSKAGVDA